jgi:alpha-L-fucosidase 2
MDNMWARLWDAENAHKYVYTILAKSTYPNLFDAHPPFQIDGNFGATAVITEMLLQSNDGILNLLPALPKQWSEGYIKGIKARGNYEIDLDWSKGELTKAVINTNTASKAKTVKVRFKNCSSYIVKCNDRIIPLTTLDNDVLSFETSCGEQYIIERI